MRNAIRAMLIALAVAVAMPAATFLATSVFAKDKLIDINSASKAELETLPGIGPVHAAAIIKGRPYKAKDELHERKIVTKAEYEKIRDKIIAHQKR